MRVRFCRPGSAGQSCNSRATVVCWKTHTAHFVAMRLQEMQYSPRTRMFQLVSTCLGHVPHGPGPNQTRELPCLAQTVVEPGTCGCRSYELDAKRCHHRGWSFLADPTPTNGVISGNWLDPAKLYSSSTTFADMDFATAEMPVHTSPKLSPGECDLACLYSWDANSTTFPVQCQAWVRSRAA